MLRAYGATGFRLARSIASLIPTPASTHIFAAARTNAPRSFIAAAKTSYTAGTLYAIFSGIFWKIGSGGIRAAVKTNVSEAVMGIMLPYFPKEMAVKLAEIAKADIFIETGTYKGGTT
jgi:hypothetical protein